MGGGLLQLVASGTQDIYLTGNPQMTYFKVVYKRITEFAMESIEQEKVTGNFPELTCTISRKGDLLKSMFLEFEVDIDAGITPPSNFASNLIEHVEIYIGGQMIDKHSGEWLHILNELTQPKDKQSAYQELTNPSVAPSQSSTSMLLINEDLPVLITLSETGVVSSVPVSSPPVSSPPVSSPPVSSPAVSFSISASSPSAPSASSSSAPRSAPSVSQAETTPTYVIDSPPTSGTLSPVDGNQVIYTPPLNYNGSDSFTYHAVGSSVNVIVEFTITSVNDPPVANIVILGVNEDQPINITLSASDVDGDELTYFIYEQPTNGTLGSVVANQVTYTPNTNFWGSDIFKFYVSDGTLDSAIETVNLAIVPVNDVPIANDISGLGDEDTVGGIIIYLSSSDIDGDTLSFIIDTPPTNGTLGPVVGNQVTYTPNENYHGSDSFTYHASDGSLDSDIKTATITVTSVNDAPVSSDLSATTVEDTPIAVFLSATDADGDSLTYVIDTPPTNGTLSAVVGDQVTYTPNADYNGADSFTYRASDGTLSSEITTVTITITPVNDAPVSSDLSSTTDEDTPVAITLVATDIDGDSLTYVIDTPPTNGTLSAVVGDQVTYTPNADYSGADNFTYHASDGTTDSSIKTVAITVNLVSNPPVAYDLTVNTDEDTAVAVTLAATDSDGDLLTYIIDTQPTNGTLSVVAGDQVTYTPTADFTGSDSFTYHASDGTADSSIKTVSITVNTINDPPVATFNNWNNTNEDFSMIITLLATDSDGDSLTYIIDTPPTNGTLSAVVGDEVTYTPNENYHGYDTFTYHANDGTHDSNIETVKIDVHSINDAPVSYDLSPTTIEDTSVAITLVGTDIEGDSLEYRIATSPPNGTLSAVVGDQVTYTPNADYNGVDSFTYYAYAYHPNGGSLSSPVSTVTITVTPVNDAPVADDLTITTDEFVSVAITLVATDSDGDSLTYIIDTPPTNGTLSAVVGDQVTYTPIGVFTGSDSFTYHANDGSLDSATQTVSVTVTPLPMITPWNKYLMMAGISEFAQQASTSTLSMPLQMGQISSVGADIGFDAGVNDLSNDVNARPWAVATVTSIDTSIGSDQVLWAQSRDIGNSFITFRRRYNQMFVEWGTVDHMGVSRYIQGFFNAPPTGWYGYYIESDGSRDNMVSMFEPGVLRNQTEIRVKEVNLQTGAVSSIPITWHGSATNGTMTGSQTGNFFVGRYTGSGLTGNLIYTSSLVVTTLLRGETKPTDGEISLMVRDPLKWVIGFKNGKDFRPPADSAPSANFGNDSAAAASATQVWLFGDGIGDDGTTIYNQIDTTHTDTFLNHGLGSARLLTNFITGLTNSAPVATDLSVTVEDDWHVDITLQATDIDPHTLFTYAIDTQPTNGTLGTIVGDKVTYTPNANYNGADSFTYHANDGSLDSATQTVSITVNPPVMTTTWLKYVKLEGQNDYAVQQSSSALSLPLQMGQLVSASTIPQNADTSKTSDDVNARPWAIAFVAQRSTSGIHQKLFSLAENNNSVPASYITFYRHGSTFKFVWGNNNSNTGSIQASFFGWAIPAGWFGFYIESDGWRGNSGVLSSSIRFKLINLSTGAVNTLNPGSFYANWGPGNIANVRQEGSLQIGRDWANIGTVSNKAYFASLVVTTLLRDETKPTDGEISMMVRDPLKWIERYKNGKDFRPPADSAPSANFGNDSAASASATQVWLFGDGATDAVPNIYNQIDTTHSDTRMTMVSGATSNLNIPGLT